MSAMTKKEWMEYIEKTWDAAQREAWSEPQFECPRCGHCCQAEVNKEAMKLALEALESDPISHAGLVSRKQAITALRQALEEKQEPFEYWNAVEGWVKIDEVREHFNAVGCGTIYKSAGEGRSPLYTAPPKQWVGLTEPELHQINPTWPAPGQHWDYEDVLAFVRAIEAKLKVKNGE